VCVRACVRMHVGDCVFILERAGAAL